MREATSAPRSRTARTAEPSEHEWAELLARHHAALAVIRSGAELDGALLLSYVIWPTDWINTVTGSLEQGIAA